MAKEGRKISIRTLISKRTELTEFAVDFANRAHSSQRRRYTGEAYVHHLIEVHNMVAGYTDDPVTLQAALLHDVVEDTPIQRIVIETIFGAEVAEVVWELTDQFVHERHGNRAARKAREAARLGNCSARAQPRGRRRHHRQHPIEARGRRPPRHHRDRQPGRCGRRAEGRPPQPGDGLAGPDPPHDGRGNLRSVPGARPRPTPSQHEGLRRLGVRQPSTEARAQRLISCTRVPAFPLHPGRPQLRRRFIRMAKQGQKMPRKSTPKTRELTLEMIRRKGACADGRERYRQGFGTATTVDEEQWPRVAGAVLRSSDFSWLAHEFLSDEDRAIFFDVTSKEHYPSTSPRQDTPEQQARHRARAGAFAALYVRSAA